jgi:hypothetical protein
MNDTALTIKQTLGTDPEMNFLNWELNVQDVVATTGRTIAGAQGLLGLVLDTAQWESLRGFECVATVPYPESTPALLNSRLPSAVDGNTRNTVATKRVYL